MVANGDEPIKPRVQPKAKPKEQEAKNIVAEGDEQHAAIISQEEYPVEIDERYCRDRRSSPPATVGCL
jgi:hypothetical protein